MILGADLDAAMVRLDAWRLREAQAMAREILVDPHRVNFSVTTLSILVGVADGRLNPGVVAMRRLSSAWDRWDRAGNRQARRARPLPRQGTAPRAF